MKIAVYGATGNVGSRIVAEAARRGHSVTALSRHEPAQPLPEGASWRRGDAADLPDVAAVGAAHDAVISAFGPDRTPGGDPAAFTGQFVAFARALGSSARLGVVGGAGSLFAAPGVRLVDLEEFPAEYRAESLAHAGALDALRTFGELDWFYLSPAPELGAGERTGGYQVSDETPAGGWISFDDLAVAAVDELETPAHRRARFTVATR